MSVDDAAHVLDFEAVFGHPPAVESRAPGRVNLIGDHTDYHGGYVLPMAIPRSTGIRLRPSEGRRVRALSRNQPADQRPLSFTLGEERTGRGWLDYVQGVTHVLARQGHALSGFDLLIESDLPLGAGLSSSAALEVALLRALRAAFRLPLDDVAIALLGRAVENDFVGVPSGVMDQMASSLGGVRTALFLDTRTLRFEKLNIPEELAVVVVSSGVSHSLAAGQYRVRRDESMQAARALGVEELRDVAASDQARVEALPEPQRSRARHVITENERVLAAVAALQARTYARLGELLLQSHASLRDDYAVSTPELDTLVDLAVAQGAWGARLTGGGFGGSIVAVIDSSRAAAMMREVTRAYQRATGLTAAAFVA